MTDEQWTPVLQFIKFCIVGATNTVISYVLNILVVFALSGTKLSDRPQYQASASHQTF